MFAFQPRARDTSRTRFVRRHRVPIRYLVSITVLVILVSSGVSEVLRALRPGLERTRRGRISTWIAGVLYALGIIALEAYARYHAPVGGGIYRIPIALVRGSALILVATVLLLWSRNLLVVGALRIRDVVRPPASTETDDAAGELPPSAPLSRREALGRASATAILAVTSGATAYGGLRTARDLRVREFEAYVPDLPPELEGLTVVQLTDVHVGIFTGTRDFAAAAERANALRGDLVVMTGDLLDFSPKHIPDAMAMLSRVRGRLGTYAVLGNHDYYAGYAPVLQGLQRAGIRALVNEGVLIQGARPERSLALLGVDDVTAERYDASRGPDLARAVSSLGPAGQSAPRLLLAHNPTLFKQYAGRVALQLSGHTHGGQINPVGITNLVMPFVSGRYDRKGSMLVVSNGLGLTGPPVRFAAPPEVVRIGLTGRRRG